MKVVTTHYWTVWTGRPYVVASAFASRVTHLRKEVSPLHSPGNRLGSGMPFLQEHKSVLVAKV